MKRQPSVWEKMFTRYPSDREYLEYKRNSKNENFKRTNNPIKKWGKELNREFSQDETQMAEKYFLKCSASLFTREIQIKTTLRFHFIPVTLAKIPKQTMANPGRMYRKNSHPLPVGVQTSTATMKVSVGIPHNFNIYLPCNPAKLYWV